MAGNRKRAFGWWENPAEGVGFNVFRDGNRPYLWPFPGTPPFPWFTKALYRFELSEDTPLTYHDPEDFAYRPYPRFLTDLGSTPATTQLCFPKDLYLRSYVCHDCICQKGGMFVRLPGRDDWAWWAMTRSEGDHLLRLMIGAEGGSILARTFVYAGVRAWAWVTGQWK